MEKIVQKRKSLLISSLVLVVVGFIIVCAGFLVADNKVENLKWKNTPPFYQTVRVDKNNDFRIEVRFGPFQITRIW